MRRMPIKVRTAVVGGIVFGAACASSPSRSTAATGVATPKATVHVIRTYPHDPAAFTQGLEVRGDDVYESTGLYGSSEMRRSSLRTGAVRQRVPLDANLFAEGMTLLPDGRIVQITWQERVAIFRDAKTLAETSRVAFPDEGWGVCYSASKKVVVHSDGSNLLRFRDPKTLAQRSILEVKFGDGRAPTALNELECVGSSLYANVWTTKTILKIDLNTGVVQQMIDASNLGPTNPPSTDDVLNGIAKLANGNLLLTGKRWPTSYEVKIVPTKGS